jgi:hypothetical protein
MEWHPPLPPTCLDNSHIGYSCRQGQVYQVVHVEKQQHVQPSSVVVSTVNSVHRESAL